MLRGNVRLRGNAFRAADAGNVERAQHDGILTIRQRDNDLVADNCSVLGMIHAKNFATAAMDHEGDEWRPFKERPDLLEHAATIARARCPGNFSAVSRRCSNNRLPQRVIAQDQRGHRLDHRDGTRENARVVAASGGEFGFRVVACYGVLGFRDGRGRLERDAEEDRLAV